MGSRSLPYMAPFNGTSIPTSVSLCFSTPQGPHAAVPMHVQSGLKCSLLF